MMDNEARLKIWLLEVCPEFKVHKIVENQTMDKVLICGVLLRKEFKGATFA